MTKIAKADGRVWLVVLEDPTHNPAKERNLAAFTSEREAVKYAILDTAPIVLRYFGAARIVTVEAPAMRDFIADCHGGSVVFA